MPQHRLAVMSVSENVLQGHGAGTSIEYAMGWQDAAKDYCKKGKYLQAYQQHCEVLRLDQDEQQKCSEISRIVDISKTEMERIGKMGVLDLNWKELAPFTMDPWCQCSPMPAKGHLCRYCYEERPVTIAHVHYRLEKNKAERLAEIAKIAVLAATKRKEALVLKENFSQALKEGHHLMLYRAYWAHRARDELKRARDELKRDREKVKDLQETLKRARDELKQARENVEDLKETLKCTCEEATDAENRLKRYRGC
jgi:hypothetical protein